MLNSMSWKLLKTDKTMANCEHVANEEFKYQS